MGTCYEKIASFDKTSGSAIIENENIRGNVKSRQYEHTKAYIIGLMISVDIFSEWISIYNMHVVNLKCS